MLRCSFCGEDMALIHGHAACVSWVCPLRGLDQCEPATCEPEPGRVPMSAVLRSSSPPALPATRSRS